MLIICFIRRFMLRDIGMKYRCHDTHLRDLLIQYNVRQVDRHFKFSTHIRRFRRTEHGNIPQKKIVSFSGKTSSVVRAWVLFHPLRYFAEPSRSLKRGRIDRFVFQGRYDEFEGSSVLVALFCKSRVRNGFV